MFAEHLGVDIIVVWESGIRPKSQVPWNPSGDSITPFQQWNLTTIVQSRNLIWPEVLLISSSQWFIQGPEITRTQERVQPDPHRRR